MNDVQAKIKKWITLIQVENLDDILEDIQEPIVVNNDEKINKAIFKLLLFVAHAADKCDKHSHATAKKIYKLTCFICSILIDVPDTDKFFSSIFHISRCLIAVKLFDESAKVHSYLIHGNLMDKGTDVSEIFVKILYLWRGAVDNAFRTLQGQPLCTKTYQELKQIVKYEFEIIEIAYKNYTKYLLAKMSLYLDKIIIVSKVSKDTIIDFWKYILSLLKQKRMTLDDANTYTTYSNILRTVSRILCENISEGDIYMTEEVLIDSCSQFNRMLQKNEECYQCFQTFVRICSIILQPVEQLVNRKVTELEDLVEQLQRIARKYGHTGAIKWTVLSVTQILEPLFMYWETCLKTNKKHILVNGILLETMNFILSLTAFFTKQQQDKCKYCNDDKCKVRRDIYNAVVIKARCINLVNKISTDDLTKDICALARTFLEENVSFIDEMRESKCSCWSNLWSTSGTLIYNLGITSLRFYEESNILFSLLCSCIIRFEGIHIKSPYLNLHNPISTSLHRLSIVHYNNGMYREAMTACALNGLLSYNDPLSKAFRMWSNIKYKCNASKKDLNMSMLACLRADLKKIQELGLSVNMSEYDLVALCLREVKAFQEAKVDVSGAIKAVLKELKSLKAPSLHYAYVVQLLGHHLLNSKYDTSIVDYFKEAVANVKRENTNTLAALHVEATLEFYVFLDELNVVMKQTEKEMENSKFPLHARRCLEVQINECSDIVPAYSMININHDSRLILCLQKSLHKWKKFFKHNIEESLQIHELSSCLHTLVLIGEYSRLYRYQDCEATAWILANRLATLLQDQRAIVYVTGRSISLRQINYTWITNAKEHAAALKNSDKKDVISSIAVFWLSLADFYFEQGQYSEARELVDSARNLPGVSFLANTPVYLFSLDVIIQYCHLYKEDIEHKEYTSYIVECLYAMINLQEELSSEKWKRQDEYIYSYDVLFTVTVNLSLRMNSLLAFREISAHLVRRLKMAQMLGATMRVAELLKSLCTIDLSRCQVDDCEVKLQGLEHILHIEQFQSSMNAKPTHVISNNVMSTPSRLVEPVRDVSQSTASPVLKKKTFVLPHFVQRSDCDCYACKNVSYQYLVFTSTYIRAQIYALQNHIDTALQHFHGAISIRENLFKSRGQVKSEYAKQQDSVIQLSWHERFHILDYLLLLLDFSCFLQWNMPFRQEQTLSIITLAIDICKEYKLQGHPIYTSAHELLFDIRFQKAFTTDDSSRFTVPDQSDIDISDYIVESKLDGKICTTPMMQNIHKKKPLSVRRNKTPPLLKLSKVSINLSDEEEETSVGPQVATSIHTKSRSCARPIRRKIFEEDYSETSTETEKKSVVSRSRSRSQEEENVNASNENILVKDVVGKIAPLVPDISEHLYTFAERLNVPATNESIEQLIGMVEGLKVSTRPQRRLTRSTGRTRSKANELSNKVNEAVDLFKEIIAKDDRDYSYKINSPSDTKDTKVENVESMQIQNEKFGVSSCVIKKKQLANKLENDGNLPNQSSTLDNVEIVDKPSVKERAIRTRSGRLADKN